MKIIKYDNYVILELNQNSKLDTLINFLNKNLSRCPNLIIDLLKFDVDENPILSSLFHFHVNWEKRNKSFILVSNIKKKSFKTLVFIATLAEAIDFFYMEELTRSI